MSRCPAPCHTLLLSAISYQKTSDVLQGKELLKKEELLETGLLMGHAAGHRNHIAGLYRMCTAGLDSVLLDQKADEMTQAPNS